MIKLTSIQEPSDYSLQDIADYIVSYIAVMHVKPFNKMHVFTSTTDFFKNSLAEWKSIIRELSIDDRMTLLELVYANYKGDARNSETLNNVLSNVFGLTITKKL